MRFMNRILKIIIISNMVRIMGINKMRKMIIIITPILNRF